MKNKITKTIEAEIKTLSDVVYNFIQDTVQDIDLRRTLQRNLEETLSDAGTNISGEVESLLWDYKILPKTEKERAYGTYKNSRRN